MKKFFTKKRIIWSVIVLLIAGVIGMQIYKSKNSTGNIVTQVAQKQDLKQTVLATGQVTSSTDLSLSFKVSGVVSRVNTKVGNKVKVNDILATLDQKDIQASLTSARGSLASAQANYQRVLDGSSNEEIVIAQLAVDSAKAALDNTKLQQQITLDNAYRTLLNGSLEAAPRAGNINTFNPTISGSYTGTEQGTYVIRQEGAYFSSNGLESTGSINFSSGTPMPLGVKGLYLKFPTTYSSASDIWTIEIPNTKGVNYVANLNAYNAAVQAKDSTIASAQAALDSAIAQLNLKKSQARPADLKAAQAQILSAQGQVQSALSALENTIIHAPAAGTVTKIDIKPGELAQALSESIVVQDVDSLYLEANISEANIAMVKPGQSVEVTFDALGPERTFVAKVVSVDPASTVVSGVVNYKITASIDQLPEIRPGMTANMSVETDFKQAVIAVPSRSVIARGEKQYVRVVTDNTKKTYTEIEVTTGISADGGLIEITSGLNDGQEIVTFIEEK